MEIVSQKDRERLRALAAQKAAMANSQKNDEIMEQWTALANGVKAKPTVRLLFYNFKDEVVGTRLQGEGRDARALESKLLATMVGRELFDDDTPLSKNLEVNLFTGVSPFGASRKLIHSKTDKGFHIEPLTDDIEADFHLFCGGGYKASLQDTEAYCAWVDEIIGDILPTKIVGSSLTGAMTNPLVFLIGMENYYLSMYDSPETLHKIMDMATNV